MKAQDWQDHNNNRALAVEKLVELCDRVGLSYEYTEKVFTIFLPGVEELPVTTAVKTRKTFDISKWGDAGIDETTLKRVDEIVETTDGPPYAPGELPDEFPPTTTPLEEGEPPVGDEEK